MAYLLEGAKGITFHYDEVKIFNQMGLHSIRLFNLNLQASNIRNCIEET